MKPGPKPKPRLQVIREGNPGHRPIPEGVVLPPSELQEPDWAALVGEGEPAAIAAEVWQRTALILSRSVGLTDASRDLLIDYCTTWARIRQGEAAIGREGVLVPAGRADRGTVRNPWTTVLNQYRSNARSLAAELGLTPSAATRLMRPEMEDDDDPFD